MAPESEKRPADGGLGAQLRKMEEALHNCERTSIGSKYVAALLNEVDYPLEALTHLAYLIERESISTAARDYMSMMQEQLSILIAITRDAAKFQKVQEKAEDIDLVMIAESALRLHAARLSKGHVQVHRRFARDAVCSVIGSELLHVVSNLVLNSVEALIDLAPQAFLHVRVHRLPQAVRITIADNGGGIPEHVEKLLFKPHISSKESGSGLALWLTRRIVDKHAGTLTWRTSRIAGKSGTVFRVSLPCPRLEDAHAA